MLEGAAETFDPIGQPPDGGAPPKAGKHQLVALLDALGVKIIGTTEYRRANCTAAVGTLRALLDQHGPEHLTLVIRAISESDGNAQALIDPVIRAVSAVALAHPEWAASGLRWIEAFDGLDLLDCYGAAARLKKSAPAPAWAAVAGMIVLVLRDEFGGKRRRTRAEIAEKRHEREAADKAAKADKIAEGNRRRIEAGLQLIEVRRTGRGQLMRIARDQFGLAYSSDVTSAMRVAELYADRPDIWTRVRWAVLAALAAPIPDASRDEFEAKIMAGVSVRASEITRKSARP